MEDINKRVDQLVEEFKRERDELRVKASLAKLEAMDEWHDLQRKIAKLEAKARELRGATAEASKDIGSAARQLGDEIRTGLKSIMKHF